MGDVSKPVKDWWDSLTEREKLDWENLAKQEAERVKYIKKENDIYE